MGYAKVNHVDSDDVALADTLTKGGVQKQKRAIEDLGYRFSPNAANWHLRVSA